MILSTNIADCREKRSKLGRLALVPTMGALHAGHMSLVEIAKKHADHVAVSIFVNPTQFGPKEDFVKYPRPLESDLEQCRAAGVELVFNPSVEEMYVAGVLAAETPAEQVHLDIPPLTGMLEGRIRPNHFKGVCQVVAKLFNIVQPNVACFGQKDYQQLRVLAAMTEALNWPIEIVSCPTLRETDGLAMSSRNQYLAPPERQRALSISRGLFAAHDEFEKGIRQTNRLIATVQKILMDPGTLGRVHVSIDYIAAVDAMTLKDVQVIAGPTLMAVAARVGNTRLIDNVILTP
ncbi:MAG: pantoate--beta-alanine ligase [Tepidisphaeraceae bacterium]|jgi:pantoate--beta-alanine ligase